MAAARSMGEAQPKKPYYGDISNSPKKSTGTYSILINTQQAFSLHFS
jgi:hypothetical protein